MESDVTTSPPSPDDELLASEFMDAWPVLSAAERLEAFRLLPYGEAAQLFLALPARDQADLLLELAPSERPVWMRLLPPDDAADLVQAAPGEERDGLLALLDATTRQEVAALLAYAEDDAGGLMNPRYARLRPDMTVDEAISYLRRQARDRLATIYYVYVLDAEQHLLGVVSFRELFAAPSGKTVREIMRSPVVTVREDMDQEEVSQLFAHHNFLAVPVVDAENRVKGIVTVDDIVDVVQEEATEDIQRLGAVEVLDAPYLDVGFWRMVRKRGGWLSALFIGETLTATAMGRFEGDIARAVVLALFVPLIISSGGNSGSQASTLVVRAIALGELRGKDWWRVLRREIGAGLSLGLILALIGLVRILAWQSIFHLYGEHWVLIAATVACALVGVVLFGTLAGSMLPFVLRWLRLDPAAASAPFVATLVDVTGLVIYFSTASLILRGSVL